MRVKTWVEIDQEVEVNVSIADLMASIEELAEDAQGGMAIDCFDSAHSVLTNLRDAVIDKMDPRQRDKIANLLRIQAERFQPK